MQSPPLRSLHFSRTHFPSVLPQHEPAVERIKQTMMAEGKALAQQHCPQAPYHCSGVGPAVLPAAAAAQRQRRPPPPPPPSPAGRRRRRHRRAAAATCIQSGLDGLRHGLRRRAACAARCYTDRGGPVSLRTFCSSAAATAVARAGGVSLACLPGAASAR